MIKYAKKIVSNKLQNEAENITEKAVDNIQTAEKGLISNIFQKVFGLMKTYKKSFIFGGIVLALGIYIKRKYSAQIQMGVDFYKQYREMSQNNRFPNNRNEEFSISAQFEIPFNNLLSKLLTQIDKQIESLFSLTATHEQITKKPAEVEQRSKMEIEKLWCLLKNKVFVSLFCSISITRHVFLLSQSHLLLLDKFKTKHENKFSDRFYELISSELWNLAVKLITNQGKYFENRLNSLCDSISLRDKYTANDIKGFINKMREATEKLILYSQSVILECFQSYLKELEDKINHLEGNNLSQDFVNFEEINKDMYGTITFFKIYYDVCSSSLFTSILMKGLDYDFDVLNQMIEANFEKSGATNISTPKIISFLFHIKTQIMTPENSIFKLNNAGESSYVKDLNFYFDSIY